MSGMRRSLIALIHGESGAGKSWLADTAPAPRLILDVEGGVRFTPSRKVVWDPNLPPPVPDGSWDSAVVQLPNLDGLNRTKDWLYQGPHPFRSVIVDPLTEVQARFIDAVSGTAPKPDWVTIQKKTENFVRVMRDLTLIASNPAQVVVFLCGSREDGQEHVMLRPALAGQMSRKVVYAVDVAAYLEAVVDGEGQVTRTAYFVQHENIAAKDRTNRLGVSMEDPSIAKMLDLIYGPEGGDV